MIQAANTPNLTGVTISGDFYDLDNLVNAFYEITTPDDGEISAKDRPYLNISNRILGLCYNIRHAGQGDRDIFTRENGILEHHQEQLDSIIPRENVYFSVNILYPEIIVSLLALDELIKLRMIKLSKSKYIYDAPLHKDIIWDGTIITLRMFQSVVQGAVSQVLTPSSFTRWRNLIHKSYIQIHRITNPFVDVQTIAYLKLDREQRSKKLLTMTKRLVEFEGDPENWKYRQAIDDFMEEHHCEEEDIRFEGIEYPERIEW